MFDVVDPRRGLGIDHRFRGWTELERDAFDEEFRALLRCLKLELQEVRDRINVVVEEANRG